MQLLNTEEESLWKETLLAYLNQGRSIDKGAHLKFADRVVEALRRRKEKPDALPCLDRYRPQHMSLQEFTRMTKKAVESTRRKIPAIKELREKSGLGLKDAKEAVEAYVGPNFTWSYY